jgi:hypothetical protein
MAAGQLRLACRREWRRVLWVRAVVAVVVVPVVVVVPESVVVVPVVVPVEVLLGSPGPPVHAHATPPPLASVTTEAATARVLR